VVFPDVFHFTNEVEAKRWVERHRFIPGKGGWDGEFVLTRTIDPKEADRDKSMLDYNFPEPQVVS